MENEDNKLSEKVAAGAGAAAITSGLAAIGGSMLGGIAIVAAAPVAAAVWARSSWIRNCEIRKNRKKLEEENRKLKEELSKK